jgi:hypothetical protein
LTKDSVLNDFRILLSIENEKICGLEDIILGDEAKNKI